jgi:hypothetical protein
MSETTYLLILGIERRETIAYGETRGEGYDFDSSKHFFDEMFYSDGGLWLLRMLTEKDGGGKPHS